jgi:hypothetical protein
MMQPERTWPRAPPFSIFSHVSFTRALDRALRRSGTPFAWCGVTSRNEKEGIAR